MADSRAALRAFHAYARYVFNSIAKWNLLLAVLTPLVVISAYIALYIPSTSLLLSILATLTGIAYYLLTIVAVYYFTLDFSRGTHLVFLSQPLTRRGYALAWMLASAVVPALAYVLSLAVPFLVLDARALLYLGLEEYALLFLEGFTLTMMMFSAGLALRRPSLVILLGLVLHLLLPTAVGAVYSIMVYSGRPWLSMYADAVAFVSYLLYPYRSKLIGVQYSSFGVYSSAALAAALVVASLEYARRRLEVSG
ncbi:hypothetical protein [Infirmifilum sp.]|uniref:hypothetical protein n=1 Tax=Infirmifilum sp. TaxID=2856575 RepID=UPI003D0CCB85